MASSAIQITIDPARVASVAALGPEFVVGLRNAIGRGINNRLVEHMDKLEAERPNEMGGTRTHFYGQVRDSIHLREASGTGDETTISISHVGFAQRYFGGTIRAGVNASGADTTSYGPRAATKYLAIPARAEAYGKRPSDFSDLHFVKTARGGMLVQNDQQAVKIGSARKDGTRKVTPGAESGGGVMFWLVTSVTQKPDPTVLPTDDEIIAAAVAAGDEYADLQLVRAGGGGLSS